MEYKLGDTVKYSVIAEKKRKFNGNGSKDLVRADNILDEPRTGVICGYRHYPVGKVYWDNDDGATFNQDGTIQAYLVAWNIHRNPDAVLARNLEHSNITPNANPHTIMSPYEETLVRVIKTINYNKYGYIYRLEQVMFSLQEPDEVMDMKVCYSLDGQYLGNNKTASLLCRKYGIREFVKTAEIQHPACVGFNPVEQKWYGWSHRAIYGFGIGSKVERGDCGYKPKNKDDMFQQLCNWYEIGKNRILSEKLGSCCTYLIMYKHDDVHREEYVYEPPIDPGEENKSDEAIDGVSTDGTSGQSSFGPEEVGLTMITKTEFSDGRDAITHESFHAYPKVWGKGCWTAATLEDAKQMAMDFAEGVS